MTEQWRTYDERRGWIAYDETPRDPRRRISGYGTASLVATAVCGVAWVYWLALGAFGAALSGEEWRAPVGSVLFFGALPLLLATASIRGAVTARQHDPWSRFFRALPAVVTVAAVTYAAVAVAVAVATA